MFWSLSAYIFIIFKGKADIGEIFVAASRHGSNEKIKDLLSDVFTRNWPKDDTEDAVLDFVISWPVFMRYLSLFCKY